MKCLRILALLTVALAVALGTGCGDDDGGTDTSATTGATQETTTEPSGSAGETTTVSMDEYSFDPNEVVVNQGDSIEVKNDGAIAHNLTIEQGPDPKEKSKELAETSTFQGGKSEELTVNLKPGKYAMACTVSGHRELGMTGTVTVK